MCVCVSNSILWQFRAIWEPCSLLISFKVKVTNCTFPHFKTSLLVKENLYTSTGEFQNAMDNGISFEVMRVCVSYYYVYRKQPMRAFKIKIQNIYNLR